MRLARPVLLAAAAVLAPSWTEPPATAREDAPDLVLVGGRIFTGDPGRPWAEAVAVRAGRVQAVGRSGPIRSTATRRTRVIELRGRAVIPGLNDAHVHVSYRPDGVTLPDTSLDPHLDEVVEAVGRAARRARAGAWIYGTIGSAVLDDPSAGAALLDAAAPRNPVLLFANTGHGAVFNSAARRALGVGEEEVDPPGGWFVRLEGTRRLQGVAHEYAGWMLSRRLALLVSEKDAVRRVRAFSRRALQLGITSVQDMPTVPAAVAERHVRAAGTPLRWRLVRFPMGDPRVEDPQEGNGRRGDPASLLVWGRKWILDGTFVDRLAARHEYADVPGATGRLDFPEPVIASLLERTRTGGEPLLLHVAGERTADAVLGAMERAGRPRDWRPLRVRFEHGDGLTPGQVDRAARLGVVVVQNPWHFTLPDVMAARTGPERVLTFQPLRSLLDAGVPLALGSDGPLNPFLNVLFAVTHPTNPGEAITREEAILAYTRGAAFAEFAEGDKGVLAPGFRADLAVLSQDPFLVEPALLPRTESVLTLIGGRVVYDASVTPPHQERSAP
jgi:predicted amidohydrolase YtcJ